MMRRAVPFTMRVTVFAAKLSAEVATARATLRVRFASGLIGKAAPNLSAALPLTDFGLRTAARPAGDFADLAFGAAGLAVERLARPLRGRALRLPGD
jgi:hypothetical protein